MHNMSTLTTALTHQLYAAALGITGRLREPRTAAGHPGLERDRGAVSLEQVLWFVAAGVSVAVIAGVLWSQIKDKADDPITPPAAP
jgi:hypothetical protein